MAKNNKKKKTKTSLHSITFYIPHKQISFFTDALKEVSKRLYSGSNKRTVSKYLREIIYEDLKKRNLLNEDNSPNLEKLEKLKKGEVDD